VSEPDSTFSQLVYEYIAAIPSGRVMTYGQVAALCGHPRAARIVGTIAHWGPEELPWHRLVNKQGRMAGEFPGGRTEQARRLEAEGLMIDADTLTIQNMGTAVWEPHA
jgi:methylated-DNA-protein-cysteine methyltransferase-like protein